MRRTLQRKVILEELKRFKSHPTADELYREVRKRLPNISIATVYRNIEMPADAGEIRRVTIAGRKRRYDPETRIHYHVRCVKCGRVDDLSIPVVDGLEDEAEEASHYTILGHGIEFWGVCPTCRGLEEAEGDK